MLPAAACWPDRKAALRALFEEISGSYDRLNHLLSLGLDRGWRERAAREALGPDELGTVVDLASGTGDQVAALLRRSPRIRVLRIDLSPALLIQAGMKLTGNWPSGGGSSRPGCQCPPVAAEMELLPVRPGSCRAITMAFALRHVERMDMLLSECVKVLEPGGRVAFVDMSLPSSGLWALLYRFYFVRCLPRIARLLGGEGDAYDLMVQSVLSFPGWDVLEMAAQRAGLREVRTIALAGGAARILTATR